MFYQINYFNNYSQNIEKNYYPTSFKAAPDKKIMEIISEKRKQIASMAIAAAGMAGIELSKSEKMDVLDTAKTLYEVKEPVKNNFKKYLSREVYVNANEYFLRSGESFDSYIEFIIPKIIKNYEQLDNIRKFYLKDLLKEILQERFNEKELPLDFSDIPELLQKKQRQTNFMNLFFAKEVFERFIHKNMTTTEMKNFLYAGQSTISLRLQEYSLKTECSVTREILSAPEIDRKILELYKKGLNQHEIAREMTLRCSFVQSAFKRLGIKTKRQERTELAANPVTIAKIIKLRKEGKTLAQIAEEVTISKNTVREILIRNGEKSHIAEITSEETIAKIEELYDKGYNLTQISIEIGCSDDYVSRVLKSKGKVTERQQQRKIFAEKKPLVIEMYLNKTNDLNKIAEKHDLSWKQVYGILYDAGILTKSRAQTHQDDKKVINLFEQNLPVKFIAERLEKSNDYVYKVLRRNGKRTERSIHNEQLGQASFKETVLKLFKDGYSPAEIAELMVCDSRTVRNIINDNGQKTKNQLIKEYRHSKELRNYVIKLFNENMPIYKICEKTHKEFLFIATMLENENLLNDYQQKRRLINSEETEKEIRMLFKNGCSASQIADFSGFAYCTMRRRLRSMGLLSARQKYSEQLNRRLAPIIIERIDAGEDYKNVAEDMGITLIRLFRILKTYKPVTLPDVSYEKYSDDELKAKINNLFFENEKLFNDESIIEIFDFIESQKAYSQEQKELVINLIQECEKVVYKKTTFEKFYESNIVNYIYSWMENQQKNETTQIDEFENLISDFNDVLTSTASEIIKDSIKKNTPYSINDKNIEKAKLIRNIIKESGDNKIAEYKLLYLEEKSNENELLTQAEKYASDEQGNIDIIKAGQYILCTKILQNSIDKDKLSTYPKGILSIIKQARVADKYKIEYLISLDNWNNLDDNEKSKLTVFKKIFNQKTDISKAITYEYIGKIYQHIDSHYVALRENGGHENVVLAASAKQGIISKHKIGKNAINLILKFEYAMTKFVGDDSETGIKYLDNLGFYEVKIPRPHIDRVIPSKRSGYYFDKYLPRGLHDS